MIITLLVFLIIKTLVIKPIFEIVDAIQNDDEYGIPKESIPNNNVKEFNELSLKMNEMISSIKNSKNKIKCTWNKRVNEK